MESIAIQHYANKDLPLLIIQLSQKILTKNKPPKQREKKITPQNTHKSHPHATSTFNQRTLTQNVNQVHLCFLQTMATTAFITSLNHQHQSLMLKKKNQICTNQRSIVLSTNDTFSTCKIKG